MDFSWHRDCSIHSSQHCILRRQYVLANTLVASSGDTDSLRTVPKADLAAAEQIAASLFFANVFGSSGAVRGLNFLIALSSFGNLLTVLIGSSRMLRECGRYDEDEHLVEDRAGRGFFSDKVFCPVLDSGHQQDLLARPWVLISSNTS